jgi:hypothetical protein
MSFLYGLRFCAIAVEFFCITCYCYCSVILSHIVNLLCNEVRIRSFHSQKNIIFSKIIRINADNLDASQINFLWTSIKYIWVVSGMDPSSVRRFMIHLILGSDPHATLERVAARGSCGFVIDENLYFE